jgi:hypothetical protein
VSSSEEEGSHDIDDEELKQAPHLDYDSIEEDNINNKDNNNGGANGGVDTQNDSDHDATYEAYNDTAHLTSQ